MRVDLETERDFPRLQWHVNYDGTSERDKTYNCIAYAVGLNNQKIWPQVPDILEGYIWPDELPDDETLDTFSRFFALHGFEVCFTPDLEANFDKIVIYGDNEGVTHAAKQLETGHWSSKLGDYEDITHYTLECIQTRNYGRPLLFMKKARTRG